MHHKKPFNASNRIPPTRLPAFPLLVLSRSSYLPLSLSCSFLCRLFSHKSIVCTREHTLRPSFSRMPYTVAPYKTYNKTNISLNSYVINKTGSPRPAQGPFERACEDAPKLSWSPSEESSCSCCKNTPLPLLASCHLELACVYNSNCRVKCDYILLLQILMSVWTCFRAIYLVIYCQVDNISGAVKVLDIYRSCDQKYVVVLVDYLVLRLLATTEYWQTVGLWSAWVTTISKPIETQYKTRWWLPRDTSSGLNWAMSIPPQNNKHILYFSH